MASKLITSLKCPYCHGQVEQIPDYQLKKNPHERNVEFVVTKRGFKQYFHTSCFIGMVKQTKLKYSKGEDIA